MTTRVVISTVIALVLAGPAYAQEASTRDIPDTTRRQIEAFERSLRGAIDSAAAQLSKRVKEAFPKTQIGLRFQTDPIVMGVLMPDDGAVFTVLIPAIDAVDLQLYSIQNRPVPPATPPTRMGAAAVVIPDDSVAPLTDPNGEYTKFTHSALVDALLDSSLAVPIPADKYLTVIAGELLAQPSSPFVQRSRTLILQIKGEDLLALRQNRISRDDAKAKIKEFRY